MAPKKVFVSGCYDLLHSGHVEFFRQAAEYGDLYVGIGSDKTIEGYKHHKTIYSEQERLFMVKAIRYVKDAYINAGSGKELTIKALTELVAKVVGYTGRILWDTTRPNGTPRKLLDVSKATALGWTYKTELEDGIRLAYEDFLINPMRAER